MCNRLIGPACSGIAKRLLLAMALCLFASSFHNSFAASRNLTAKEWDEYQDRMLEHLSPDDSVVFMHMCDTVATLSIDGDKFKGQSMSLYMRISYLSNFGYFDQAKSWLEGLKTLSEKTDNYERLFRAWSNVIMDHINSYDILSAQTECTVMQEYAVERNNYFGMAMAYCNLGCCYQYSPELAIENFKLSVDYYKKAGATNLLSHPYMLTCFAYSLLKQWDSVIKYAKLLKGLDGIQDYHLQTADILLFQAFSNKGNKAEAARLYKALEAEYNANRMYSDRAIMFAQSAVEYLCKCGAQEDALPYMELLSSQPQNALQAEIMYRKARGEYQTAVALFEQYDSIRSQDFSNYEKSQLGSANAQFKNQVLEIDNQQLEIANERSQNQRNVVLIIALLVLLAAAVYIIAAARRHNIKLRIERDRTEQQRQIAEQQRCIAEEQRNIAEEQRQIAEEERAKAVHLSDMKSTFIHNMAHEVRTPLNSIMGFNALLNTPGYEFSEAERQDMVGHINLQSENLMHLLDNVIYLSRIDGNDFDPYPEDIRVIDLVDDIAFNIREKLQPGVELTIDIDPDAVIRTDHEILEFAVNAVLDNAAKFTTAGEIKVASKVATENGNGTDAAKLRIAITDTGSGIPAGSEALIFERFEKLGRIEAGFGLGLSCAQESLRFIGGTLTLDTSYTTGARLVIEVPNYQG